MGEEQVDDLRLLNMTAQQANELVDNLAFEEFPSPEDEETLRAQLPPGDSQAPVTVVTSLRLPLELKRRLDAAAEADGVTPSAYIRAALERVLASRSTTNLVNLDDVIRAVRSLPHAA